MSADSERIERLVTMAERLIEALEADIAALKAGKPQQMRTIDPEIQRLSAIYGREAQGFSADSVKQVPTPVRKRFFETTGQVPRPACTCMPACSRAFATPAKA